MVFGSTSFLGSLYLRQEKNPCSFFHYFFPFPNFYLQIFNEILVRIKPGLQDDILGNEN